MSDHPDFLPQPSEGQPPSEGEPQAIHVMVVPAGINPRIQRLLDRGLVYMHPHDGPQLTLPSRLLLHVAGAGDAVLHTGLNVGMGALVGWLITISPLHQLFPETAVPIWQVTALVALLATVARYYIPVDIFHSGFQDYLNEALESR